VIPLLPALLLLAQAPIEDPLLRWMDGIAQQQLARREAAIALIHDVAAAAQRQKWVRAKLLEIIGGLPEYRGPLNARVTARIANASYTLEKVIFESLPHFYVTANLYRPNAAGKYPAVLLSAGHTALGKTENHRIAANLAAKGFVALAYDPIGLGERMQAFDARIGRSIAGCCANEHLQAGAQSMLAGQSVARYFIHDAVRALDYIESRPEVDASRIGAAGCSGGGCLTTYIAALDLRIKAAAPACFLNSFRLLFAGPDPDSEMSLPGFLSVGLDHADFLEAVAPRVPWLVLTTEGDFFTPPGARLVYEEARRWYGLYGAADKVQFFIGPGPHGTPIETREQIYAWMIRWLKDGQGDAREADVPLVPDHELQVTPSGQVEGRKLYEVIHVDFQSRRQPRSVSELVAELVRLGIAGGERPPDAKTTSESREKQVRRFELSLTSEPGVDLRATLFLPPSKERRPALLLVKDQGSATLAQLAGEKGFVALELEPRNSPPGDDRRPFLGEWLTNTRADSIGLNLPALRARDLLRGVDYLAARPEVDPAAIRAAARDVKGFWLLLAAAVDPRISRLWLDRTPNLLVTAMQQPLNTRLFDVVMPGFLLHWDIPDLVKALGTRRVLWTDPSNWMGQIVPLGAPFRYRTPAVRDEDLLAEMLL